MSINSLTGVNSAQQQQAIGNAGDAIQKVIASIVTGQSNEDSANVSIATQLQSETAGLKQVSGNIAQTLSLTQVAQDGTDQVHDALVQLQTVAENASDPTLNSQNRAELNRQFQGLVKVINQVADSTSFNGQKLLNGNLSGSGALSLNATLGNNGGGNDSTLAVSDLSASALFGGQNQDVLSADSAGQALNAIGNALNSVTATQANIGAFQSTLNFAGANVDTAITNQEAASASLNDTDIAAASTALSQDNLKLNAGIALEAQTNKFSPTLLKLIG